MTSRPLGHEQDQGNPRQGDAKVTLYWLEKSRSQRVLWLLEELKLKYDLKTFHRINMLAPDDFKKLHPLGKAPVVGIETSAQKGGKPLILAESSFIIEYLIDHFGPWLAPKKYADEKTEGQVGMESESWLRYQYFMPYSEGSLMPLLVTKLLMEAIKSQSPFFVRPLAGLITGAVNSQWVGPQLKMHWEFLEKQLATSPDKGDFLCGPELSGADIILSFPISAARAGEVGLTKERYPRLWAYVDRLEGLDAYKRSVAKIVEIEGKYELI